jgi:tRNA nucleotidyltransferase (CCA-adding enzyme)
MDDPAEQLDCYLVGGAVRDALLGLTTRDRDWVVVGSSPEDMLALGFQPVGQDFPVFLHPQTHEEYALARRERKVSPGYRGFAIDASSHVTLEEDLARRDLTINAMARAHDGRLIDPWHGARDIEQRRLQHVSASFADDPVRILRVARFAARYTGLGFTVAEETMALMRAMAIGGEIDALVAERVWQEIKNALSEDHPRRFFETLSECQALHRLLPELDHLATDPNADQTPDDVPRLRSLNALDKSAALSRDPRIRFAALVHDLGDTDPAPLSPSTDDPTPRAGCLLQELCDRLRVPKRYRQLATMVVNGIGPMAQLKDLAPQHILSLLQSIDAFRKPDQISDFACVCRAALLAQDYSDEEVTGTCEQLQRCFEAARNIEVGDLATNDCPGEEIRTVVAERRVDAIALTLQRHA